MASEKQIEANRNNALKSTGPRTDDGKAQSRANAVKHGMSGLSDIGLIEPGRETEFVERRAGWARSYQPVTEAENWALDRAIVATFRIDRCEQEFEKVVADHANHARFSWDEDREIEAEAVAAKLARQPGLASRRLRANRHGCELLIALWSRLDAALEANGTWTDEEISTALDLLALPRDLRAGRTPLDPPAGVDALLHRQELVALEIDRLDQRLAEAFEPLDDLARRQASSGLGAVLTAAGRLVLRYENEAWRRYRAALKDLHNPSAAAEAAPRPSETKPISAPAPAPPRVVATMPPPAPINPNVAKPAIAPLPTRIPALTGTSYLDFTIGRAPHD